MPLLNTKQALEKLKRIKEYFDKTKTTTGTQTELTGKEISEKFAELT
ncbi:MAG: hypothetical protein I3273_06180, partial [Candidatus Moeniiplasma glomeromycotorum]|nr:hypothetical protein [Candidatus Moeniiplasma glomeromycotorum]MCE8169672.1 hypothetical protein [Candidatus Moeniiplasma glomeromycotorum]